MNRAGWNVELYPDAVPERFAHITNIQSHLELLYGLPQDDLPPNITRRFIAAALGTSVAVGAMAYDGLKPQVAHATPETPVPSIAEPEKSVYVLGDSLLVGQKNLGLAEDYAAHGIKVLGMEALGGRQIRLPACEPASYKPASCEQWFDGLRTLERDQVAVGQADVVVVSLGTNGTKEGFEKDLWDIGVKAYEIGSSPDGKAPALLFPQYFGGSSYVNAQYKNDIQAEVVARLNQNGIKASVLPRDDMMVARGIDQYIANDDVHMTSRGYDELNALDIELVIPHINTRHTELYPVASLPELVPDPAPIIPYETPPVVPITPSVQPVQVTTEFIDLQLDSHKLPRIIPQADNTGVPQYIDLRLSTQSSRRPEPEPIPGNTTAPPEETVEPATFIDIPLTTAVPQPTGNTNVQMPDPITEIALPPLDTYFVPEEPEPQPPQSSPVIVRNIPADIAPPGPNRSNEVFLETAAKNSIFYDPVSKRAMTYLSSFYGGNGSLRMSHGFNEPRDLPDTGFYRHANTDWKAAPGTHFVSPGWGVVHIYPDPNPGQKKGVGNAVAIEFGVDEATGKPLVLQSTHFSQFADDLYEGMVVRPGQTIGFAGETGIAYGAHFSVGMSSEISPYSSIEESYNPANYFGFDYECLPDARNDNGEICGPDGTVLAVPVPLKALQLLGIPEYLTTLDDGAVVSPEPLSEGVDFVITDIEQPASVDTLPNIDEMFKDIPVEDKKPDKEKPKNDEDDMPSDELLPDVEDEFIDDGSQPEFDPEDEEVPPEEPSEEPEVTVPPEEPSEEPVPEPDVLEPPAETPVEPVPEEPAAPPAEAEAPLPPTIPERIYTFFTGNGYTHAGAVGIMANIAHESGFDPTRTEIRWNGQCAFPPERLDPSLSKHQGGTENHGFGLVQWTTESRQLGLQAYADSKQVPWTDLDTQLEYIIIELQSGYFGDLDTILRTTEDMYYATESFLMEYERPASVINGNNPQGTINQRNRKVEEINGLITGGMIAAIDVACD